MARTRKKPPAPAVDPARLDGFVNAISGLGTSVDRLSGATVRSLRNSWQSQESLETLYYEADLAARIVDAIVDDAMRQGIELDREVDEDGEGEKDQATTIERRMRDLGALQSVSMAARWGRLYGGGAVLLVMDDGKHDAPLALGRKVVALTVLDRWELTPVSHVNDVMAPNFGEVETWRANPRSAQGGQSLVVHSSRLLMFEGLPVSRIERARQSGWSLSVLTRAFEVLRDGEQNWRSVSNILSQSTQPIFKIKGLAEMIANGHDEILTNRMAAANLARSALRAVLIDSEGEDFRFESASLAGLDVILDKTWQRLAAAADMPVTRLMGMSPAGLNATGASDVRGWYDRVQAYRETALGPQIETLVEVLAAEAGDQSPAEWCVRWPSLWQMSPTEEATHRKTIADTDAVYLQHGVVTAAEVAEARYGGGTYSDATPKIDTDLREQEGGPAETEAAVAAVVPPVPAPAPAPVPGA